MVIGGEAVVAPLLSVALAVIMCVPALRLALIPNGLVVSTPIEELPSKNSTLATGAARVAVASIVTSPGTASVVLFAGLVMVTTGCTLAGKTFTVPTIPKD